MLRGSRGSWVGAGRRPLAFCACAGGPAMANSSTACMSYLRSWLLTGDAGGVVDASPEEPADRAETVMPCCFSLRLGIIVGLCGRFCGRGSQQDQERQKDDRQEYILHLLCRVAIICHSLAEPSGMLKPLYLGYNPGEACMYCMEELERSPHSRCICKSSYRPRDLTLLLWTQHLCHVSLDISRQPIGYANLVIGESYRSGTFAFPCEPVVAAVALHMAALELCLDICTCWTLQAVAYDEVEGHVVMHGTTGFADRSSFIWPQAIARSLLWGVESHDALAVQRQMRTRFLAAGFDASKCLRETSRG